MLSATCAGSAGSIRSNHWILLEVGFPHFKVEDRTWFMCKMIDRIIKMQVFLEVFAGDTGVTVRPGFGFSSILDVCTVVFVGQCSF